VGSPEASRDAPRKPSPHLPDHVIDHVTVLVLRAEHDDLRVGVHPDVVPGRPVEQVVHVHRLLRSLRIGRGDPAAQDEAPVGALAEVAFQALEERGGIDTRGESEILAADLAEPARVAEFLLLADQITAPGISIRTSTSSFATRMLVPPVGIASVGPQAANRPIGLGGHYIPDTGVINPAARACACRLIARRAAPADPGTPTAVPEA